MSRTVSLNTTTKSSNNKPLEVKNKTSANQQGLWKVILVKETCCLFLWTRLEIWFTQYSWLPPPHDKLINELTLRRMNRVQAKSWPSDRCKKVVINGGLMGKQQPRDV